MIAEVSSKLAVKSLTLIALSLVRGVSRGMRSRVSIRHVLNWDTRPRERRMEFRLISQDRKFRAKPALTFAGAKSRHTGDFMAANSPVWVTDLNAEVERENRVSLALLRGVAENLKSNRIVVPVFGLAICAMFPP